MVMGNQIVTTEVDALIKLVKDKKEISMEDAAKQLGMPIATIESWATFLEEEKIMSIEYKFTKPFLVAKKIKKGEVKKAEEKISELPSSKEEKRRAVVKELEEELPDVLKGKGKPAAKIVEAPEKVEKKEEVKVKKKEEIKEEKKEIKPEIEEEKKEEVKLEVKEEMKEEKPKEEFKGTVDELITQASNLVSQSKFDSAMGLYRQIQDQFQKLPEEFKQKELTTVQKLAELNTAISQGISRHSKEEIETKIKKLKELRKAVKRSMWKKDLKQANKDFNEMKSVYDSLPEGYLKQKTSIQEDMLKLHDELVATQTTLSLNDIKAKENQMQELIDKGYEFTSTQRFDEAAKIYQQAKDIHKTLPPGFLEKKTIIRDALLKLHEEIVKSRTQSSVLTANTRLQEVSNLLNQVEYNIRDKNYDEAERLFKQLKAISETMPKGFLEKQSNMQRRILLTEELLLKSITNQSDYDFKLRTRKIKKLAKVARKYMEKNNYDLANAIYMEMITLYNSLPRGFQQDKLEVNKTVSDIYEKIIQSSDYLFLQQMDEKIKQIYNDILKLLVEYHLHVENSEFSAVEDTFSRINKAFENFPISFIKKKLRLVGEVNKLGDELKLYKNTEELLKAKTYQKQRRLLSEIYGLHKKLADKTPEHKNLFDYVKEKSYPICLELIEKGKEIKFTPEMLKKAVEESKLRKKLEKDKEKMEEEQEKQLIRVEGEVEKERKEIDKALEEEREKTEEREQKIKERKEEMLTEKERIKDLTEAKEKVDKHALQMEEEKKKSLLLQERMKQKEEAERLLREAGEIESEIKPRRAFIPKYEYEEPVIITKPGRGVPVFERAVPRKEKFKELMELEKAIEEKKEELKRIKERYKIIKIHR